MLAVHLENRRVAVKRVPRPRVPQGFALIRLLCGGICNTDLELQRGYYDFSGIPGPEFAWVRVVNQRNATIIRTSCIEHFRYVLFFYCASCGYLCKPVDVRP